MKNLLAVLLVLSMLLALAACGAAPAADTAPAEETVVEEAPAEESYDPMVDCIQMDNEEGALTFLRVEPAHEALTEEENDYVFVFDFTNKMSKPDQCQTVFQIFFICSVNQILQCRSSKSSGIPCGHGSPPIPPLRQLFGV